MRIRLSILLFAICSFVSAQTQQGVVKTPTRRNVNGTMTRGQYIPNATVAILLANNNAKQSHASGNQGKFSFYAPSPYYITSVTAQKGSYTFLDADFSKKQRQYSNNVVEVLVDDPNVLAKVRDEAIAYERSKIRKQIRAKEDEIEALKEANKITTAEYNKILDELSEYRKSSEAIVQQIAEVYATTDFDKMDDFNKKLLAFVEEGNFKSADSLLRTQGSKEELFEKIKKEEQAIKKTEDDVNMAKEYNNQEKEALARRLYSEHLMYLQKPLMQDSALYCLKMRADLDTTNVKIVKEYADLCLKQNEFKDCEKYYLICLRKYVFDNDSIGIADICNCLGNLYSNCRDFKKAEQFYMLALKCIESLLNKDENQYCAYLANTQNNLSILFGDIHDYDRCEQYAKMALENYEIVFKENPDKYRAQYARAQNNLARLYGKLKNYDKSESYFKLALDNFNQLYNQNPNNFCLEKSMIHNNLGILYMQTKNYENSELQMKLGLELKEQLCTQNPDAYTEDLARTQKNLGSFYITINKNIEAEKYLNLALENIENLFNENPNIYRSELSFIQNNLGIMFLHNRDYTNSRKYLIAAMENKEQLFSQNPKAYRLTLAQTQHSVVSLFKEMQDYNNSLKYGLLLLGNLEELDKNIPGKYSNDIATAQKEIAQSYLYTKQYVEAFNYINKAILLVPKVASFYDTKGEILLMQGKNEEALEMWKKVLELDSHFLDYKPDGTNLSNGLKKLGLIK